MVGDIEISTSMKDMIERYEAITQDTFMARSLYFNAFDELRGLAHDGKIEKPQIVVFIDDLDRCFPEKAVHLLESVKLILHQPNFAFVLGIYPQIIEEFIRNKYAAQYPMAAVTAASKAGDEELRQRMNSYLKYFDEYLDKIIQVRHYIPERQPDQMQDYIEKLLDDAGVTSEFFVKGVNKKELLNLIAEVGRRNPRDIVRKINGLIVKWRIAVKEEAADKKYDLLSGLINEAMADRVSRDKQTYEPFLQRIEWTIEAEGGPMYGEALADALKGAQEKSLEGELRINHLRRATSAEKSPTMNSLIDVLKQDEPLCNVLSSDPGQRWLRDKAFREETRETFQEKEIEPEIQGASTKKAPKEGQIPGEAFKGMKSDHILDGFDMIPIQEGEFEMGSEKGRASEQPVHHVKVSAFEISATPITQAQYEAIMGSNPSYFKGPDRPVENVSWEDAIIFCEQLTKKSKAEGYRYMLPSEAQWEYAYHAGSDKDYSFGDERDRLEDYAWYDKNSGQETHPVCQKEPNKWGLYDMHGNVWEWCEDSWHDNYEGAPSDGSSWSDEGSVRVLRSGSWYNTAEHCRSAYRDWHMPSSRGSNVGFRVARSFES